MQRALLRAMGYGSGEAPIWR